ncbi:PrsW family glutamic-type intramembrane protease [Enhygromyxa salina]|uniref:PrsW family glutamic-type intramembrane protease n=1 Tax=Enhygromyxa salina TaxID=215803 RepID=UPI0015E74C2B|nr:PrsW family glutamic-type intramembrane protease [Enhygromyxa salina]
MLPPALLVGALARALATPATRTSIALAFACGAALLLPVYGLLDLHELLDVELGTDPYPKGLYRGFVLASAPEELCRVLAVWAFAAWAAREQPRPHASASAVVYGAAVMLGFASLENCVYVHNRGWEVLSGRMLTALPFNAALGVIAGACVGEALARGRGLLDVGRRLILALGLVTALHGAYDAPLLILYETNHKASSGETVALASVSYAVFGLTLLAALALVRRARRQCVDQRRGSTTSA